MTFTIKKKDAISVHIHVGNLIALSYLIKMWGLKSQELAGTGKVIWKYLLKRKNAITVKYLPGSVAVEADKESRHTRT